MEKHPEELDVHIIEYFVDENGDLRMRRKKFKDKNISIKCQLSAKDASHHAYGVYLY